MLNFQSKVLSRFTKLIHKSTEDFIFFYHLSIRLRSDWNWIKKKTSWFIYDSNWLKNVFWIFLERKDFFQLFWVLIVQIFRGLTKYCRLQISKKFTSEWQFCQWRFPSLTYKGQFPSNGSLVSVLPVGICQCQFCQRGFLRGGLPASGLPVAIY